MLNSAFPGLMLEYQIDNGPWYLYNQEDGGVQVEEYEQLRVRAKNVDGSRFGRALNINH